MVLFFSTTILIILFLWNTKKQKVKLVQLKKHLNEINIQLNDHQDILKETVKVENDLISLPSTRGTRYFGPSKMSFYNLIKHSLSIISVFKKTFLIRSAIFIIFYILLIKSNASIITSIPLVFLLIAVYSISNLALRENMDEFDKSLENISSIDIIK